MNHVDTTLYLVTNSDGFNAAEFLETIVQACEGGVTLAQLREKERFSREYYELAVKVKAVTDRFGVPLIIDDRVDIALAVDAAGVHLGQADLPISAARRIMGPGKIIGATAKTVPQALQAESEGADYLGVGAIYPTTTKVVTVLTPVTTLSEIARTVKIPVVAIGGLNAGNLDVLYGSGADGIAVVTAIMNSANPKQAAQELRGLSEMIRQRGLAE
ncbi:MAG: thiamine phosphate synthase [Oscillospiraceae bacterium]|nr:thiamine phosphate synthase [Oscillospiraceae bacterium]